MIARISGKPIEIQIRTDLQHSWAEFSEKCADMVDPAVKYGGGPEQVRAILEELSNAVAASESSEKQIAELNAFIEAQSDTIRTLRQQLQTKTVSHGLETSQSTQERIAEIEDSIEELAASYGTRRQECDAIKARQEDNRKKLVTIMRETLDVISTERRREGS